MKKDVTVVVEDRVIIVDGDAVVFTDRLAIQPSHRNLWAIQWHDRKGELEFKDSPNVQFDASGYSVNVSPYVRQWEREKERKRKEEEERAAQIQAEWNKPENVEVRAREERDRLLYETDYLFMPDYPFTEQQRAAWAAYRQALRELPKQDGWPINPVWPEKPEK